VISATLWSTSAHLSCIVTLLLSLEALDSCRYGDCLMEMVHVSVSLRPVWIIGSAGKGICCRFLVSDIAIFVLQKGHWTPTN